MKKTGTEKKARFDLKKLIHNDSFIKALSVILAVIAWFIVSVSINPTTTTTVKDIPISMDIEGSIVGKLGLEAIGYQQARVNISVSGKRYIIGGLDADDFVVTGIFNQVTAPGTYDIPVSVQKRSPTADFEIVNYQPMTISMTFDRMVTKEFSITPEVSGVKVPYGYISQEAIPSYEKITISGSENDIIKIARCVVAASVNSEVKETFTVNGEIVLYDKDNVRLDLSKYRLSTDSVDVTIPIYKKKTVPFTVEYLNVPQNVDTYEIDYTMSAEKIDIAGPIDTVADLDQINLGYIDFKKVGLRSRFTFDVTLPSGIININNLSTVNVEFMLDGFTTKTLAVPAIKILNPPINYDVSLETTEITNVKMVGLEGVMEELIPDDLVAEVDLSRTDIAVGQITVPVKIVSPDKRNVWAYGEYSVLINVMEAAEQEES